MNTIARKAVAKQIVNMCKIVIVVGKSAQNARTKKRLRWRNAKHAQLVEATQTWLLGRIRGPSWVIDRKSAQTLR